MALQDALPLPLRRRRQAAAPLPAAFAVLWLAVWAACLTLGAAVTFLPLYVAGPLGGSGVAVGVTVGAFAAGACLVRPLAGVLADHRGRRVVVLGGAVTMAVASLGHLAAPDVGTLVAARVLLGVGEGAVFTAGAAWAVDLAPPAQRGRTIGLFGLTVWLGLALGPIAGQGAYALAGYDGVWVFTAVCPAVAALLLLLLPPGRPSGPRSTAPREWLPRAARRPGAAIALAAVGFATLATVALLLLEARGVANVPLVFTAFGAAVVVTRLVAGGLPDRLGAERCAAFAGLLEAAGLAVVALASSLEVALAGAALLGMGFSTIYPALALLAVRGVPDDRRGAVLGLFTACFDIGVGLGAPLAGAVAVLAGRPAALWLAAACAVGAAVAARGRSR